MSNIFRSVITGTVMSLSRLNQLKQRDSFLGDDEDDIVHEQQVKKQEIKIVSEKRFYELLNAAEEAHKLKNAERTASLLESRGINENFLSFRNEKFYPPVHEQ